MVSVVRLNFIVEATQENRTKIFMYFGPIQFERFISNNGIIIRNRETLGNVDYLLAKKDKKQTVITGNEALI